MMKKKIVVTGGLGYIASILKNLIQLIPSLFLNYSKAKYKYFKIERFICSVLGFPSFKRSKFDKK